MTKIDSSNFPPANFDDTTPTQNRPIDAGLPPETIVRDWQYMLRGARIIERPRDVMFDIDDVLCPTIDEIHRLAFEAGLHDGTIEPAWDGAGQYGCDPQVYWDLWSQFAAAGGYTNTPPIAEAAEALRRLYFAGHHIHLVTARGFMAHAEDIRKWTQVWVDDFALPWHTLTFAQDKVAAQRDILGTRCPDHGGEFIPEVCDGKSWATFDYAIDDRRKTIEALRAVGVEAYLLTHSHNREEHSEHRVGSVSEFVEIILEEA